MAMTTIQEKIENRRSLVRVIVTYGAGLYIVIGSIVLIVADALVEGEKLATAKEIFTLVLPVATGIITYWFASRRPSEAGENTQDQGEQQQRDRDADQARGTTTVGQQDRPQTAVVAGSGAGEGAGAGTRGPGSGSGTAG